MSTIQVMTVRELLDELGALSKEHPDFMEMGVYLTVVSRAAYDEDMAGGDYDEDGTKILGDGSAYSVVVPTEVLSDGSWGETYVLIRAVELEEPTHDPTT